MTVGAAGGVVLKPALRKLPPCFNSGVDSWRFEP